jgi:hypothetical protein
VSWTAGKRAVQTLGNARFDLQEVTTIEGDYGSFRLPPNFVRMIPELASAAPGDSVQYLTSYAWGLNKMFLPRGDSATSVDPAPSYGGGRKIVSGSYTLSLWRSSALAPVQAQNLDEEILVTIPFDTSPLSASDQQSFLTGSTTQCLHWESSPTSSDPFFPASPWSSTGCRVQSIQRALSDDGTFLSNKGTVTCACNHLTTFAVANGVQPVRFVAPTPLYGDVFQAESGHAINFTARAISDLSSLVRISVEGIQLINGTQAFKPPQVVNLLQGMCVGVDASGSCTTWSSELSFSWTPAAAGDYTLYLALSHKNAVFERRAVSIRVLFCEHFMLQGQSLRDIAGLYHTSWQALFALNPQIANPREVNSMPSGRSWLCGSSGCLTSSGETSGVRVRIGKVVRVAENQTVAELVAATGSSLVQLARHNTGRLKTVDNSMEIYDIVPPGQTRSDRYNVSYTGVELCLISSLADGCYLN